VPITYQNVSTALLPLCIPTLNQLSPHIYIIKMALAPKFAGQKFSAASVPTLHTVELYLDYVCPFSAKMFNTIYTSVLPLIRQKYPSKVQIIFRQQIQPWHPSSTLVHEAGVAVLKLQPAKFWDFSKVGSSYVGPSNSPPGYLEGQIFTFKGRLCLMTPSPSTMSML
jgi:hypothetical protein